jgi:hypothetical protein
MHDAGCGGKNPWPALDPRFRRRFPVLLQAFPRIEPREEGIRATRTPGQDFRVMPAGRPPVCGRLHQIKEIRGGAAIMARQ